MAAEVTDTGLLTSCGQALYGPNFQAGLARDLVVNDRTVRRWVAGDVPVPVAVWADVATLMSSLAGALRQLDATGSRREKLDERAALLDELAGRAAARAPTTLDP